jgi:uncharacterized protein
MTIDGTTIPAGEKRRIEFPLYETVTGTRSTPVTVINGASDGPTFLVLAGCHPGEYNGIVSSIRLAADTEPDELSGQLIVVHAQNLPGLDARTGHNSPIDGVNMGRSFPVPGDVAEGTGNVSHQADAPTNQAARRIFDTFARSADAIVDLHGGEFFETLPPNIEYLLTGNSKTDDATREFARSFGIELLWEVPTGSIPEMPAYPGRGSIALEAGFLGIPGVFFEVGGEGKIDWSLVDLTLNGLRSSMTTIGMMAGLPEPVDHRLLIGGHVLFADRGGFAKYDVCAGQQVASGELLGSIFNFSGETIQTLHAQTDSVMMNVGTKGAVNPGDMMFVMGNIQ